MVEISKPKGALIVMLATRLIPLTLKLWGADTLPVHAIKLFTLPARIICGILGLFRNTEIVLLELKYELAVTKSGVLSAFKSPIAKDIGYITQ